MSFAAKHNTTVKLFLFEIPESFTYVDFKQLASENGLKEHYKVNAIYINKKGRYGDQPVIATDNELVNAPHHMLEGVKEILADAESVAMINNGVVGFKLYTYENQHGTQYSLEWIDWEPKQESKRKKKS